MAITTIYLSQIEKLLGDAYESIRVNPDTSDPYASYAKINEVKALSRGGYSSEFGVVLDKPDREVDVGSNKIQYDVDTYETTIQPSTYRFGDNLYTYEGTEIFAIGQQDAQNNTLSGDNFFPVIYTVKDLSTYGGHNITLNAYKGYTHETFDEYSLLSDTEVTWPSYDPREVVIARQKVNPSDHDFTCDFEIDNIYFSPPSEDDMVSVFSGLYSSLASEASRNGASVFSSALSGLDNYMRKTTGLSFKNYWKSQKYKFTDNFRRLWAAGRGEELTENLAIVAGTLGSVTTTSPYSDASYQIPSSLEVILMNSRGTSGTVEVSLLGVVPSYSVAQSSHIIPSGGTQAVLYKAEDWPTGGYMWFNCPEKTKSDRLVRPYTKPYSTLPNEVTFDSISCDIPAWSQVRFVESINAVFATGSPSGSIAYTATQTNKYLGIACATVSLSVTTGTMVLIRNT